MANEQVCPICSAAVLPFPRYPRFLCKTCAARAVTPDGRPLRFFNVSMSGGYAAVHADDDTPYDSHHCRVDGVACHANEARFGGVVIQTVE